ncbi:proteasome assembly chaperone family protein [Candidatus Woesearchaeota archaeon]|nr:proteasome assembly chaperone family protein [Candidatus Woesearchaeota archaeon]
MKLQLKKKVKNPTIIEGFPGFGLVGTIATEYLLEHLECEQIGKFWFEDLPATIAIHSGKVVDPIGIFYNKKYNIVIVHAILTTNKIEWKVAEMIEDLANQTKAKEIICLEGVGTGAGDDENAPKEPKAFYYTNNIKKEGILKKYAQKLNEGIIVGATSALLLKSTKEITALFADTHSQLPDSKAAAKLIILLDNYIGLNIDPKPLLETAKRFEEKLKTMLEQGNKTQEEIKKKQLSYVG